MRKWRQEGLSLPPIGEREVLRYAGVKGEPSAEISERLRACISECEGEIAPRVVACVLTREELIEKIPLAKDSQGLRATLGDCQSVLLFAATVGLGLDRKILRAASIAPSKALFYQAIGAERIEAVCDCFCEAFARQSGGLTARFSAGYGDFSLEAQRSIFQLLDCPKEIGLTLTEGLLMSPTKSVSAIAGIKDCPAKEE